jgi:DNA invertase Pin-like site-specific DNA recombinase
MSVRDETVIDVTATLGYARVSTSGEETDALLGALFAAGIDPGRVFTERLSGSVGTSRPGLPAMP